MESCIVGYAITTECLTYEIKEIKALEFQVTFIDALADLLEQSREPRITVSLFRVKEVPTFGVIITPVDISDVSRLESKKSFLFRINLVTNETVIRKAYGQVLALVKIVENCLEVLQKRYGLTIVTKMSILNHNEIALGLTITKTT